jgi:acetyl-CoA carboxylase carboxyltransferase component
LEEENMTKAATSVARKRIAGLLDEGSFLEIGGYVTARSTDFNMDAAAEPTDGVITGYGTIGERLVYVYSQDAAVLGGSIGEMHAAKICRIYELAMKMGAPVIGLIDCAGLRLQEATDALHGFGSIYRCQCDASGVIPQITAVLGSCGGGMALVPSLTDFTFMEEKAKIFVNAPNTLDGNTTAKCDTAGAEYQSVQAGSADVAGEAEIFEKIRTLISILPANNEDDGPTEDCQDDLNRLCPEAASFGGDTRRILESLSDDAFVFEVKEKYHPEMVTAFIRLDGMTVGAVANRSAVYGEDGKPAASFEKKLTMGGCEKAARFVRFCDAFEIPVLSLTQVTGFLAVKEEEAGIARAAAVLTQAFAGATVPKINVIVGEAEGSAYLTMNSKSVGADLVYAWPGASIGMMDPQAAARIMYAGQIDKAKDKAGALKEAADKYAKLQSSAEAAARRGYVDHIIAPEATRKYLAGAFNMLYTKREDAPARKHSAV